MLTFDLLFLLLARLYLTRANFPWKNPCLAPGNKNQSFCNQALSFEDRAKDLVYNVESSLPDALNIWGSLFNVQAMPVAKLSIPEYQWGNEALHGVANSFGVSWDGPIKHATMFPMPIATACSFNKDLFYKIGSAISTEARAMHNNAQAGLTFWAPNINIYRDPRWGRGQETPGEDPFLTAIYATNFVRGMQGYDQEVIHSGSSVTPKYLKSSACCKHYADYSIEQNRDSFNAIINDYDQNDTYLVAFKSCVTDADVSGIMCSYNAINGIPACADKDIQTDLLRGEWGFNGYITSDCGAVADIFTMHHYTKGWAETAAVFLTAGGDMNCGAVLSDHTVETVQSGILNKSVVQLAQYRLALLQMRLGMFDTQSSVPYSNLGPADVCTNATLQLSLSAARQSVVVLKNNRNVLPIDPTIVQGPLQAQGQNAQSANVMWGDYYGNPPFSLSLQDGINLYSSKFTGNQKVVIIGAGLTQSDESELKDRNSLILPSGQDSQIQNVVTTAKQQGAFTILVIISGGCVDIAQWQNSDDVDAIIWAGYGGMYGGQAIADVIFGTFAPVGRLDQTWYLESYLSQQAMSNMGMRPMSDTKGNNPGRGYRYFPGKVIYEFGFGLSYTNFSCTTLTVHGNQLSTTVKNTGKVDSGAVVLVFFVPNNPGGQNPLKRLVAFSNVEMIKIGQSELVTMTMYSEFEASKAHANKDGSYVLAGIC